MTDRAYINIPSIVRLPNPIFLMNLALKYVQSFFDVSIPPRSALSESE